MLVRRLCISVSRAPGNPEVSKIFASDKREITSRASAQGAAGDAANVVLSAVGNNLRLVLA